MKLIANIIGIMALILFFLSYQQKKRKNIILFNALSRVFYIIQYILLSAFSGAVLDLIAIFVSLIAQKKDEIPFVKKHVRIIIVFVSLIYIGVGLLFYKNIFSIFPIFGVLFHTGAFWITDEKKIRLLSLVGSPFWLIYNLSSHAFGSAIGDTATIFSIIISIVRYDVLKKGLKIFKIGD